MQGRTPAATHSKFFWHALHCCPKTLPSAGPIGILCPSPVPWQHLSEYPSHLPPPLHHPPASPTLSSHRLSSSLLQPHHPAALALLYHLLHQLSRPLLSALPYLNCGQLHLFASQDTQLMKASFVLWMLVICMAAWLAAVVLRQGAWASVLHQQSWSHQAAMLKLSLFPAPTKFWTLVIWGAMLDLLLAFSWWHGSCNAAAASS